MLLAANSMQKCRKMTDVTPKSSTFWGHIIVNHFSVLIIFLISAAAGRGTLKDE